MNNQARYVACQYEVASLTNDRNWPLVMLCVADNLMQFRFIGYVGEMLRLLLKAKTVECLK